MGGKQAVDEERHRARRVHLSAIKDGQQIRDAGNQQKEKRHSRQKNVEGDPPSKKQHIVFGAVVPDPFGVVAKGPAEADNRWALPRRPASRRARGRRARIDRDAGLAHVSSGPSSTRGATVAGGRRAVIVRAAGGATLSVV